MSGAAVLAVPLLMCCGLALDYTMMNQARASLQEAADSAALASAKELGLASTKDDTVKNVAKNYVSASFYGNAGGTNDVHKLEIETKISDKRKDVTVDLAYYWKPLIIQYMYKNALPIKVTATASLAGEESICVIALDTKGKRVLDVIGKSKLLAKDCSVYSNSASSKGLFLKKNSSLQAASTYTAGGYSGRAMDFQPLPVTDSPVVNDPLADRVPPAIGKCMKPLKLLKKKSVIFPGTYCGGLSVNAETVVFMPGIYVIKDGPLEFRGKAVVKGSSVGFYFTGKDSTFTFMPNTRIVLTAPRTGPMSGILFFEDRNSPAGRDFLIKSKRAERIEGTIYLPKGTLKVQKESKVGLLSAWTAIVASKIKIQQATVQINSDYKNSIVPVPEGIGPSSSARLTR